MRILYLKLRGFKGIMAGMGRKEIEIDFSASDKRLILFLGANGSGKSTIMTMLHPFADSFDDRSELILDGVEGYKEIHIQKGNDVYRIEHHYGKKMKSFIYKNDENLNVTGGVRTFAMTVSTELGVDAEIFKIIRIGSNSTNFIDLNSSARKTFIGRFTPSIEEFIAAFKVVNDKLNASNREVKYLGGELGKLPKPDEVEGQIDVHQKTLRRVEAAARKSAAEVISLSKEIDKDRDSMEEFASEIEERDRLIKQQKENNTEIAEYHARFSVLAKEDRAGLAARKKKIASELEQIGASLNDLLRKKSNFQTERNTVQTGVSEAQADLRKYRGNGKERNTESLKELIEELETKVETLTARVGEFDTQDTFPEGTETHEASSEVEALKRYSADIVEARREILSCFDTVDEASEYLFSDDFEAPANVLTKTESVLEDLKKRLKAATKNVATLHDREIENSARREMSNLCASKTCLVYKIGQQLLQQSDELKEAKREEAELKTQVEEAERQIEVLSTLSRPSALFRSEIFMFLEFRTLAMNASHVIREIMSGMGNLEVGKLFFELTPDEIQDVLDLESIFKKYRVELQLADAKKNLAAAKEKLEVASNSEGLVRTLNDRVEKGQKRIDEIRQQEAEIDGEIESLNTSKRKKTNSGELLDVLIALFDSNTEIEKSLKTLNRIYEKNWRTIEGIKEKEDRLKTLREQQEQLEEQIQEISTTLNEQQVKLQRIREFEKRLDDMNDSRERLKIVKEALDIRTGIPLHILGSYLEGIKDETNRLLNLAFGENFTIDFQVSDTDFFVPVYKNGVLYGRDVKECSQGEKAMVKSNLSLGITSRAIRHSPVKYNIVYLDEVDAELDAENRYNFLTILERLLDALDNEQTFIITHNEAFWSAEVGLVLLRGSNVDTTDEGFMCNKEVIADFRPKGDTI